MGSGSSKNFKKSNDGEPNLIQPQSQTEKSKKKKSKKTKDFEDVIKEQPKGQSNLKFSESQLVNDTILNSNFAPASK